MKKYILIILFILLFSCNSNKKEIGYGTFKIYEDDSLVGTIYRNGNFQLEKYRDNTEIIAQIDSLTESTYLLSGIENKKTGIESIVWLNTYKKIGENKFQIIVKPNNSKIEYEYKGTLLKTDNNIPKKYSDILNKMK